MSGRRLRTLFLLAAVGAAVTKAFALMRARAAPDTSRHPAGDGGTHPPSPSADPYQAPVVEPAAVASDLDSLAPLDADSLTGTETTTSLAPDAGSEEPAMPTETADPGKTAAASELTWVMPVEGACPDGYAVKAKVRSGIYHLPGVTAYGRTTPDRCYSSAAAAEADGLRPAKR